jgi:hypothetical protein
MIKKTCVQTYFLWNWKKKSTSSSVRYPIKSFMFESCSRFAERKEGVVGDKRPVCLVTMNVDENVEKMRFM